MSADLPTLLAAARAQRDAGAWGAAARLYAAANELDSASPEVKHNLALCHFGLGQHEPTLRFAAQALALRPDLWQSRMLQAKVALADGRTETADTVLRQVLRHDPLNASALTTLADIEMNEYGDPLSAAARVAPLARDPATRGDAELTTLMAKLYDRDESDAELSEQLKSFAARELTLPAFRFSDAARAATRPRVAGRRRVGLLSPLFSMSPVFFFTIGALRALSRDVDLVLFSRSTREDWATRHFRTIAREWHPVAHLAAEPLADALRAQDLDVLIDMGGWMDPVGLRAVSTRPAPRLYKWVGGQSATTGLTVFDGFLTDAVQTPDGSEPLYTEPLVRLPGGYVTYEPNFDPEAIRAAAAGPSADGGPAAFPLAVIGNPAKISRAFLDALARRLDAAPVPAVLFADRRYAHAPARRRILDALPSGHRARLHFRAPKDHSAYLTEVARADRILDTFPYNGGLTSVEAMHLGKPIEVTSGDLFASRHTASHAHYWLGRASRFNHTRLGEALGEIIQPAKQQL